MRRMHDELHYDYVYDAFIFVYIYKYIYYYKIIIIIYISYSYILIFYMQYGVFPYDGYSVPDRTGAAPHFLQYLQY